LVLLEKCINKNECHMTQTLPLSAKGVAFMTYSFSGEKKGRGNRGRKVQ